MKRVLRFTKTQLQGAGKLDQAQIKRQLAQHGFDLSQKFHIKRDADSIYYTQGDGDVFVPEVKLTDTSDTPSRIGHSFSWGGN